MAKILHSLLRKSLAYGLFNCGSALVPFLALPILTRHLTPEAFGILTMFQILLMYLPVLLGSGIQVALRREYVDRSRSDFAVYSGTILLLPILPTACLLILTFLFSNYFVEYSAIPKFWIFAGIFVSFVTVYQSILMAVWQIQGKPFRYGFWQLGTTLAKYIPALIAIGFYSYGWTARAWSITLTSIISLPVIYYLLRSSLEFKLTFSLNAAKRILAFTVPLIPYIFCSFIVLTADRFFIVHYLGITHVGIYSAGFQVAQCVTLLNAAFSLSWEPYVFTQLNTSEGRIGWELSRWVLFFILATGIVSAVVVFSLPWVSVVLLGSAFRESVSIVPPLIVGFLFQGTLLTLTPFILYTRKNGVLSLATILMSSINLLLNILLIPHYGLHGAAYATVIAYLSGLLLLIKIIYSQQRKIIPHSLHHSNKR